MNYVFVKVGRTPEGLYSVSGFSRGQGGTLEVGTFYLKEKEAVLALVKKQLDEYGGDSLMRMIGDIEAKKDT